MQENHEMSTLQSGASNPENDLRSLKKAKNLYEQFRNINKFENCGRIANHTRFSIEQLIIIRDYIFENCHWRRDGKFERFDPNYEMAESWRRLSEKSGIHIKPHDVLMLEHELYEIEILLHHSDYSVTMAHEIAEQKYNYAKASKEYYDKIFSKQRKEGSVNNNLTDREKKSQLAMLNTNTKISTEETKLDTTMKPINAFEHFMQRKHK